MLKLTRGIASVLLSASLLIGSTGFAAPEPAYEPLETADLEEQLIQEEEQIETEAPGAAAEDPEEESSAAAPKDSTEASALSAVVTVQGYDSAKGYMEVRVSGVPVGTRVVLAAWPTSDPDDAHDFTVYGSTGATLIYRVPITEFGLREGWYTFEARVDGKAIGSAEASMYFRHGVLTAVPTDDTESTYSFDLGDTLLPGNPRVYFIVTNTRTGSRSLHAASLRDGVLTCTVPASRYSSPGKYKVNAIAATRSDITVALGQSEFEIHGLESSKLEITDIDGSTGEFAVKLKADAPSGIAGAVITLWTQEDGSDRREFDAEQENGEFVVRTSISEFSNDFGRYYAGAEVTMGNGIKVSAEETSAEIEPRNYVIVEESASSTNRRVVVLGPDPADESQFKFIVRPEGSDEGGKELPASTAEDGTIYSTIKPRSVADGAGTYRVYAVVNGDIVGSASFELAESDFVSEAQARIAADCQRVYNMVGRDLHSNYMWVVNNFSYVRRYGHLTPPSGYTRAQWYAVEGLETQKGNCYTFAAAFAELAKGLGYDARYVEAEVWGPTKGWQPHGIVLVNRNGGTYICDPELQFASSKGRNLYMQPVSNAKAKYRW